MEIRYEEPVNFQPAPVEEEAREVVRETAQNALCVIFEDLGNGQDVVDPNAFGLENLGEQVLLAAEMRIQRRLGDIGRPGDVVH